MKPKLVQGPGLRRKEPKVSAIVAGPFIGPRELCHCGHVKRPYWNGYGFYSRCNACDRRRIGPAKLASSNRKWLLGARYGITVEQYEELLQRQGGGCAICGSTEPRGRQRSYHRRNFAVDHCHETGEVRGLLCFPCNAAIGQLGDTVEHVQSAVRYLSGNNRSLVSRVLHSVDESHRDCAG
jgi:hypothetical protein